MTRVTPDAPSPDADEDRWIWLSLAPAHDAGIQPRPVYDWAAERLRSLLDHDPSWQSWWLGAGRTELVLAPFHTERRDVVGEVRKGRRTVQVEHVLDAARLRTDDRVLLARRAGEDLQAMVEAARERLELPGTPAWPDPGPAPEGLPDSYPQSATVDVRDMLAEGLQHLGLTPQEAERLFDEGGVADLGRSEDPGTARPQA